MLKFIYFVVKPNWQRPVILKLWKNIINQCVVSRIILALLTLA